MEHLDLADLKAHKDLLEAQDHPDLLVLSDLQAQAGRLVVLVLQDLPDQKELQDSQGYPVHQGQLDLLVCKVQKELLVIQEEQDQ